MMIKTVVGDLLDATEDIIVQQVNCRSVMGSGVAKAIYTRWPEVKTEYHKFCRRSTSPYDLLGKVQLIDVEPGKAVANVFGQLNYGRTAGKVYTDYVALTKAFDQLRTAFHDKSLAFPYNFGCGLANGSWSVVLEYKDMQVDHIIPINGWSEQGEDTMDNMLPACRSCNHYKSRSTLEGFRKMVENMPAALMRDSVTYKNAVRFGLVTPTPHPVKFYFEQIGR